MKVRHLKKVRARRIKLHRVRASYYTVIMMPHGKTSLPIEHNYLFLNREDYKSYRRKKLRLLTGVYPIENVVLYEVPVSTIFEHDYDYPELVLGANLVG